MSRKTARIVGSHAGRRTAASFGRSQCAAYGTREPNSITMLPSASFSIRDAVRFRRSPKSTACAVAWRSSESLSRRARVITTDPAYSFVLGSCWPASRDAGLFIAARQWPAFCGWLVQPNPPSPRLDKVSRRRLRRSPSRNLSSCPDAVPPNSVPDPRRAVASVSMRGAIPLWWRQR